jgi:hypothetical protein
MAHERAKERAAARTEVRHDLSLSATARLLYHELDDMAGDSGEAWAKQAKLAARLGFCPREIRYCQQQLIKYVRSERRQRYTHYHVYTSAERHSHAYQEEILIGTTVPIRVAPPCLSDPPASLYEPLPLTSSSTLEDGRSVGSSPTTPAPTDRPTDPTPPVKIESQTPEDLLLSGLAERGVETDCRMATKVVRILEGGSTPLYVFFELLDRKIARKRRLGKLFDLAWLPQAARDAVDIWRRNQRRAQQSRKEAVFDEVAATREFREQLALERHRVFA